MRVRGARVHARAVAGLRSLRSRGRGRDLPRAPADVRRARRERCAMIAARAAGSPEPHAPTLLALWLAALAVAGVGTSLLFGTEPGVSWALVTLSVALGVVGCASLPAGDAHGGITHRIPATLVTTLALALALAVGAAVTADVATHVMIALVVCAVLAIGIGLTRDPRRVGTDLWGIAALPLGAGVRLG